MPDLEEHYRRRCHIKTQYTELVDKAQKNISDCEVLILRARKNISDLRRLHFEKDQEDLKAQGDTIIKGLNEDICKAEEIIIKSTNVIAKVKEIMG